MEDRSVFNTITFDSDGKYFQSYDSWFGSVEMEGDGSVYANIDLSNLLKY